MIIRVSELEEQGLRFDDVAAFPSAFSDPAWRLESIALEVEPDEGEVLVRGRLSATGPLTCVGLSPWCCAVCLAQCAMREISR